MCVCVCVCVQFKFTYIYYVFINIYTSVKYMYRLNVVLFSFGCVQSFSSPRGKRFKGSN